jgi:hypothetical protein
MPSIKIESFSGIMPRADAALLPDGCAVRAHNCRLYSGKLSPLRQPLKSTGIRIRLENGLSKIADAKTIYLWKRGAMMEFLAWPGIVRVAKGNIANDSRFRIFVSGETGIGETGNHPCAYIASESGLTFTRHTLFKTSFVAPVVARSDGNAALDTDNIRYTHFFQTWVDEYGYESGASLPSAELEYNDGDNIDIEEVVAAPSASKFRRIYKVVTGAETERIQFIVEQTKEGEGFPLISPAVKDEDAGEMMPLAVAPPVDLTWMQYMPGSFFVGVSESQKRTIMFSDVDRPTSWPDAFRYDIHDDFVGLAVASNSVFVMTDGSPWVVSGAAPESMTVSVMASPQACVSARSICVMEGAVFYASNNGICMLSESNTQTATVITEKFFGEREWEALNPSSCIMESYGKALYCWFTLASGVKQGYVIEVGEGTVVITTHDEQAKAVCRGDETDSLYYVRDQQEIL